MLTCGVSGRSDAYFGISAAQRLLPGVRRAAGFGARWIPQTANAGNTGPLFEITTTDATFLTYKVGRLRPGFSPTA